MPGNSIKQVGAVGTQRQHFLIVGLNFSLAVLDAS